MVDELGITKFGMLRESFASLPMRNSIPSEYPSPSVSTALLSLLFSDSISSEIPSPSLSSGTIAGSVEPSDVGALLRTGRLLEFSGLEPAMSSSPSVYPSPSESGSFGLRPFDSSKVSPRPSPSESTSLATLSRMRARVKWVGVSRGLRGSPFRPTNSRPSANPS